MQSHPLRVIRAAALEEDGFCLRCGSQQEFVEQRLFLGLCLACDWNTVIPAQTILDALELIDFEGEDE